MKMESHRQAMSSKETQVLIKTTTEEIMNIGEGLTQEMTKMCKDHSERLQARIKSIEVKQDQELERMAEN
jgi:hypothetical protein